MSILQSGQRGGRSAQCPVSLLASLLLAACTSTSVRAADLTYKIQPLVKAGDTIGGVKITGSFSVSAVNDHGDLAFWAVATPGAQALFSVTNGQPVVITPLVTGG